MTTSWVAGTVRAKTLARRRLGASGARRLATSPGLPDALASLGATPYAHDLGGGQTLAEAEHGVGATLLWHLRVLAGWLPAEGADVIRLLARGFEVANVDEHLQALRAQPAEPAYRLGALSTCWSRLAVTTSVVDLRRVLSTSPWGDPGTAEPWAVHVGMCLAWADRLVFRIPEAAAWARAAACLLVLRTTMLEGRRLPDPLAARASYVLGAAFMDAASGGSANLAGLAARLPAGARWALDGVAQPQDLWRAESNWWHRVERDGFGLLRRPSYDRSPVVGAVAVLAVDAWRVRAALEAAARGGAAGTGTLSVMEAFDGVA